MTTVGALTTENQHALVGVDIDLLFTSRDQHGEPTATAPTAVAVTRESDGTTVTVTGSITAVDGRTGVYKATVAAANNTTVDVLIASWTYQGVAHERRIGVRGGVYFAISEAEDVSNLNLPPGMDSVRKRRARAIAEAEVEDITGRSFVERFTKERHHIDHRHENLVLGQRRPRTVRSVAEIDGTGASTAWSAADVAAVDVDAAGIARRLSGQSWPACTLDIGYTHGDTVAPGDLTEAVVRRWAYWLTQPISGLPDRALSFSTEEGPTVRLAQPDGPKRRTGDPDVDAVYQRYSRRPLSFA